MDFSKLKTYIDTIKKASNVLSMLMVKPSLKYDDIVSVMAMDSNLFATLNNDPEKWCDEILNRLKKYNIDYLKYDIYEERTVDMKEKMQKYVVLLHELDAELKRYGLYDPYKYNQLIWTTTKNDEKANKLIPKIAGVFYQMSTNMVNLNYLFEEVKEGIKKLSDVDFSNKFPYEYPGLLAIFHNNTKALSIFYSRINGKHGSKIALEVETLVSLNIIDDGDKLKPIHSELVNIYGEETVTKYKNWCASFSTSHKRGIANIQAYYQDAKK